MHFVALKMIEIICPNITGRIYSSCWSMDFTRVALNVLQKLDGEVTVLILVAIAFFSHCIVNL